MKMANLHLNLSMKVSEFQQSFKSTLASLYSEGELQQLLFMVLEDVCNYNRIDINTKKNELLDYAQTFKLNSILDKLKLGTPIQYILGFAWFDDLKLNVSPAVLIPRQETEELVHWVFDTNKTEKPIILDLCTGSGCIALALKNRLKDALVYGYDISKEALKIARKNSLDLNLAVDFFEEDLLKMESLRVDSDIIISNPPYVRHSEKNVMNDLVVKQEPHLALFVKDDNPLIFYKAIAGLAQKSLRVGGLLFLEINEALAEETLGVLSDSGFIGCELRKDLNDRNRMIKAVK